MTLNDPYSGFDAEAKRKNVIAEVISELNEAVSSYGGSLDEPGFRNFFDERFHHDWVSTFMESPFNQVILSLRLMGLSVFKPTDGEFFIIGDSPVSVVRNAVSGETSLLNACSQVILPISSRCILVYTWAAKMNIINDGGTLDRAQVRSLNSDYYHGTKCRYIYGRDEETLIRSRLMSPEWAPRERSNEVNDGWAMMLQLEQIRRRQLEAQDAGQAMMRARVARELEPILIIQQL